MRRKRSLMRCFGAMLLFVPSCATFASEGTQEALLKTILEQMYPARLTSAGEFPFSVRLTIGSGELSGREAADIHICHEGDRTRVTVFASDGQPYAMIADGLLVRVSDGEILRAFKECGFLVAITGDELKEGKLRFGVQPKLYGRSGIDIRIDQVFETIIGNCQSVEYDAAKMRGVVRLERHEVFVQFRNAPDGRPAVVDLTVREKAGKLVIRISEIKTEAVERAIHGERFAALWKATGGRVSMLPVSEMRPDDLVPGMQHRGGVDEKMRRVERVVSLLERWPRPLPALDLVRPENKVEAAPVVAQRKQVRDILLSRTVYAKLPELSAYLESRDEIIRTDVMVGLRTAPPEEFDNHELLENMLLRGLQDKSKNVRSIAITAMATHAHEATISGEHVLKQLATFVKQADQLRDLIFLTYSIARLSEGAIDLGAYPRTESGWPRISGDDEIAWWLVHEETVRTKVRAWVASVSEVIHGS